MEYLLKGIGCLVNCSRISCSWAASCFYHCQPWFPWFGLQSKVFCVWCSTCCTLLQSLQCLVAGKDLTMLSLEQTAQPLHAFYILYISQLIYRKFSVYFLTKSNTQCVQLHYHASCRFFISWHHFIDLPLISTSVSMDVLSSPWPGDSLATQGSLKSYFYAETAGPRVCWANIKDKTLKILTQQWHWQSALARVKNL